jgi:hypothetical protein
VDYAAQSAAQQAAREAEQAALLAADRAEAVAKADEASAAEAVRLKRLKGTGGMVAGTGQLAQTEQAGLKAKLG